MQIIQKKFLHGTRSYRLNDADRIMVSVDKGGELSQFTIDVAQLDPDPVRSKNRPRAWIVHLVAGLLMALFCVLMSSELRGTYPRISTLAIVVAIVAGVYATSTALRKRFKETFDIVCYQNRFSGETDLILHTDAPSGIEVAAFITELDKRIRKPLSTGAGEEIPDSTAGEIERLALLKEKGYLSEQEFIEAKQGLLAQFTPPGEIIGFQPRVGSDV